MLTTEVAAQSGPPRGWKRLAKAGTAAALASLLGVCLLGIGYVLSPSQATVTAAQALACVAALSAVLAAAGWVEVLHTAHQEHWRTFLVLAVLTASVFAMHLYVVGSPSVTTPDALSGSVGFRFSDSQLTVTSSVNGSLLSVAIDNSGTSAVSQVAVSLQGSALPASGLQGAPSDKDPLQPSQAVQGSWQEGNVTGEPLSVSYEYLTCYNTGSLTLSPQLRNPGYGCVMDEVYYVPAAQTMLSGEKCAPYADNCNLEHPFLAKALIAVGMLVFGEFNDLGWRIANIVLGTLCVPLLYALVYLLSANKKLSLISGLLLAADTMVFTHSSAALIDIPILFFTLLAFVFYFWKASLWRFDSYVFAGAFLGLAMLAKETAVFMVAALFTYNLWAEPGRYRRVLWDSFRLLAIAGVVFVAGLQIYDSLYGAAQVQYFYQQIAFILSYGSSLKGPGWFDSVLGAYIAPLNWLTYYTPVSYLVTHVTTTVTSGNSTSTYTYVSVGYYGITNSIVVWLVFAWVPLVVYKAAKQRFRPQPQEPVQETLEAALGEAAAPPPAREQNDDRAARFALVWLGWGYVPYVVLWLWGRVTYPFYIISAIPAMSLGAAYFVTRKDFPRWLTYVYIAAAFGWFFLYFPVKDFLPVWLRVLIGR